MNPGDITWSSKNAVKVSISPDGMVTGLGAGRSKIEAKDLRSGKSVTLRENVKVQGVEREVELP